MKKKLLSSMLVICLLICLGPVVYADGESDSVEPNVYEKREINIRKNNGDQINEKKELPEEQKELTFDKDKVTESELITEELFQTAEIETNTIKSKAAQMELFSISDVELKRAMEEPIPEKSSNILMILMIIGVIVVIAMLFVIIPKLNHTQD